MDPRGLLVVLLAALTAAPAAAADRWVEVTPFLGLPYLAKVANGETGPDGRTRPAGSVAPWAQQAAALRAMPVVGLDLDGVEGALLPAMGSAVPLIVDGGDRRFLGGSATQTRSLTVAAATANVVEGSGSFQVMVVLSTSDGQPATDAVSVDVATSDGTAAAGADFDPVATSVSFPAGAPDGDTRGVTVSLLDDAVPEPSEEFSVALSAPSGGDLGSPDATLVTIIDDDAGAVFIGPGTSWFDPANWQSGVLPLDTDTVFVLGPHIVVLDGTETIGGLVLGDGSDPAVLDVDGENLTINGPVAVAQGSSLYISNSGRIDGSGDHQIDGSLLWNRGFLEGTGTTTVTSNGSFTMPTPDNKTLRRELVLGSPATLGDGQLSVFDGLLRVGAGAVFTLSDGADIAGNQQGAVVVEGELVVDPGGAQTRIDCTLANNGLVRVVSGELDARYGDDSSGAFEVADGATLEVGGGFRLMPTGSINGGGDLVFNGNTMTLEGDLDLSGTVHVENGRTRFNGPPTTVRHLLLDRGILDGSGELTVSTLLEWRGSRVEGAGALVLDAAATAAVAGPIAPSLFRPLELFGVMIVTSPSFGFGTGGSIVVEPGGRLELAGDIADMGNSTTNDVIEVHGELVKTAGAGEARITAAVDNHGLVRVEAGRLDIQGGGSSTGSFESLPGTVLEISSAVTTLCDTGSQVDLAGNLEATGRLTIRGDMTVAGTTTVTSRLTLDGAGPYLLPNLIMTGASAQLLGGADLEVSGSAVLDGCRLEGGGTLRVLPGTEATLNGNLLLDQLLTIAGSASFTAGQLTISDGARFDILSGGSLELLDDVSLGAAGTANDLMTNAGLLSKTGGAAFASLLATFSNSGQVLLTSGELRARSGGSYRQTAGETVLAGGVLGSEGPPVSIEGGVLTGEGTVAGDLTVVAGTVAPGPVASVGGALTVAGDYEQQVGADLLVQLAGPPGSDVNDLLEVTGACTLDGTLEIATLPPFAPADGDTTTVVEAATVAGDFSSLVDDDVPFGTTFTHAVNATTVDVSATVPPNPFAVASWTVDGGGGVAAGGDFVVVGTIGQPDAGPLMTGGDFDHAGGLWAVTSEPTPPETPLFADDFESGDTSAWSNTAGGPR